MTAVRDSAGIGSLRLKRLTVAASVLLVATIAALAIVLHFLDPRSLAVSLAASVKADTGRELSFGEVVFKLVPRPVLVLSDVRFGNAAWGSQPWLAQIGRASADIDVLALFSGRLRIEHIALTDASVFLETDATGHGNWVMDSADSGIPAWLKALEVDEFTLLALAFTYRDGATGKGTSVQLDDARIAAPLGSGPIELRVRGSFDGTSVEAAGTIGALALIANETAYPVDLEGKMGAASVSVHGTIEKIQERGGFNLALRAQAPELAELVALFGVNIPSLGPFRGAAQLTGAATAPVFSGIDVEVGTPQQMGLTARGELTGSVSTGGGYAWQSTGVDLVVQGAQFSDLARWYGKPLPALGRYRIAAHAAGSMGAPSLSAIDMAVGGGETPEIKLRGAVADLRAASGIDLLLEASAAEWWRSKVVAKTLRLPPFRASARLRDTQQGYRVDDLELRVADSTVSATLQVVQRGARLHVTGKATSPLIDLARLPPGSGSASASAASELPRPVDFWELADADVDLNIGRLRFPDGRLLQSAKGRFALDNGRLKVSALQATLGGANIKLDGVVADPQKLVGLDLRIALQGGELAELLSFFGKSVPPVGPYHARAQLRGSLDALGLMAIDASAGRAGQRVRVSGEIANATTRQTMLLAITANVSDSLAAGRLFGADLPRLPALRATARVSGSQGGYVFDDLRLVLGRTSVQGRVAFAPGEPRPRVTANLSGQLLDLSELSSVPTKRVGTNPLLAADVEADIRFDRVVLANRRALGPMHGAVRLAAGAFELKQFTVAVDGATATVDGKIIDPLIPAALALVVNAKVTRGVGLAAFTGLRLQGLPAFTASAGLTETSNGYALSDLKLAFAATTITGDVAVTRGAKRFKVSAKASAPLLDVSAFMRPAAASSATRPAAVGARAIPQVPLHLDVLRVIDADLDLRFDTVKVGDAAPLGPLLVHATIADGLLKAEPVQLTIQPGQTLSVSGTVDAARTAWALRIDGTGINFGELLVRFGRPRLVTGGSTDLALQLQGRGTSLPAVLGSLNGDARLKVGPHRVHNFTLNPETSIVTRVFTLANPFRDTDPDTEVKCLAARLAVKNGVFTSERNLALETAKYNAVVSGTVNLQTEAIDVAVAPVVTRSGGLGIGNVNVIVRLHGTLAAPTVAVDPVSVVVRSAASVGLTVGTRGGWWLVDTLLKKAVADPHPCETALASDSSP